MSLWRIAAAFALLLIPTYILTLERVVRYAADLRKDEPRHMTRADVICAKDQITLKAGNYIEPLNAVLGFCPEFEPPAPTLNGFPATGQWSTSK